VKYYCASLFDQMMGGPVNFKEGFAQCTPVFSGDRRMEIITHVNSVMLQESKFGNGFVEHRIFDSFMDGAGIVDDTEGICQRVNLVRHEPRPHRFRKT